MVPMTRDGVDLVSDLHPVVARMTPEQARRFWRMLDELGDDILRDDYPADLLDADLREMGLNPEALAERAREFVAGMKEKR